MPGIAHKEGSVLLNINANDASDISSNLDRIVNSRISWAVCLFGLLQRWLTFAVFSCRHSAPMPPTRLSCMIDQQCIYIADITIYLFIQEQ